MRPDPERQHEQVAVALRRAEPRRQRVDEGLDDVRQRRVDADHEQQPEQRAAERDLVDERGGRRVEQRARVRPRVREADAVVAIPGEAEGLRTPSTAVQQPRNTAPSRSPDPRYRSPCGDGWMNRMRDREPRRPSRTRRGGVGSAGARRRGSLRSTRRSRTSRRPAGASPSAGSARGRSAYASESG